jgi:hypothetical protein
MNVQTAGLVGGAAFLLSALAGLIGGVPFFDVVVRALFWGAAGFGLSLGVEALLRNLIPDLFVPVALAAEKDEQPEAAERRVDITLDEEGPASVFEEVDEDDEPAPPPRRRAVPEEPEPVPAAAVSQAPVSAPAPAASDDEDMPEIGTFLDAFKPNAPEDEGEEGAAAPEYAEYAPVDQPERSSSKGVTIDGEVQDPAILAKAIQTVMKRDGQGT